MGLFGGGNSSSDNSVKIDNSVRTTDSSVNTVDNSSTDNSYFNDSSSSVVNVTDGGAFEVAQYALDMGGGALNDSLEFGNNALDVSSSTFHKATDLVKDVNQSSLDFGQSSLDAAVDAIDSNNDHTRQLISQTIDKSLSTAASVTQSDGTNMMQGVTKIGIALAVVFGVGFIAMSIKK